MSRLDDWFKLNQKVIMEPNYLDIKNPETKKLFFEQIQNLDFDKELIGDDNRYFMVSVRLSYPDTSKRPYKFLIDTYRKTMVPQYTSSHEVMRLDNDSEYADTVNKLCMYLKDESTDSQPKKKSYYVPVADTRDFVYIVNGTAKDDSVMFKFIKTFDVPVKRMDGNIRLYYDDDITTVILTQDVETKGFFLSPRFSGLTVSLERLADSLILGLSGSCEYPDFDFKKVKAIVSIKD